MWYIYTTEYYSTKKKKEVLIPVTTWMKLENILLSERSQTQKITQCINFICMKCPKEADPQKQKVDYWFPEAEWKGQLGVTASGQEIYVWSDENVLNLDCGDDYTALCRCQKSWNCTLS